MLVGEWVEGGEGGGYIYWEESDDLTAALSNKVDKTQPVDTYQAKLFPVRSGRLQSWELEVMWLRTFDRAVILLCNINSDAAGSVEC